LYDVPIFISHSWSYPEHYDTLARWIFGEPWYSATVPVVFRDVSVPKDNPIHFAPSEATLKAAIYQRIQMAKVIVIPMGMYASHSKWIDKEVQGARQYGKPILGVNPWAQERKSSVVAEAATINVGWNKKPVVQAIWDLANGHH
jgi:hypothetical protein